MSSQKDYYPPMHTAEHILNQTMDRMFGCGSVNAHIEKKKSKCDYKLTRIIQEDEIKLIENKVNEIIYSNIAISEVFIPFEEASLRFNISKLPEHVTNQVRIVQIGEYDSCPCIGPHVSNTSQIGQFQITTWSYESEFLRLRFKLINTQYSE